MSAGEASDRAAAGRARAIGFRVKSGYAIAVALGGSATSPAALSRHIVQLCDPAIEETRQPYQSDVGEAEEDERAIARRVAIIERAAATSVKALVDAVGLPARARAGLVVGSVIDPATVGNQHIRAHANEGRLFRTVLEEALRQRGVRCSVTVEKQVAAAARETLGRSDAQITKVLTMFGRTLGSPWRTEEKSAAVAAWMALAGKS
jgi:hypothetical protein